MADIEHSPTEKLFREKILHALEVFPFLSNSMIHMAIGTSNSTLLWKPVLEALVAEGSVVETTHSAKTPIDRSQSYTIYHLPINSYQHYIDNGRIGGY